MILDMSERECEEFLRTQRVGRIGCHHDGYTYVVPVIFAWDVGCAHVYTTEGLKVALMRANPRVCLEADEYLPSGAWRSVIVQGTYEEQGSEQAGRTLALLMERMPPSPGRSRQREQRAEGRMPVAFLVRAREITGRRVDR